jgi:hypothetical protein
VKFSALRGKQEKEEKRQRQASASSNQSMTAAASTPALISSGNLNRQAPAGTKSAFYRPHSGTTGIHAAGPPPGRL